MESKILKSEVLLTRRCDLKCPYCKIIKKQKEELTTAEWLEAFRIIYDDLGASFIAIYGGEPLVVGKEKLKSIIKYLNTFRPKKSYTIISNCMQLDEEYIKELVDIGLDSWTSSVDTINFDSMSTLERKKSEKGLWALEKFNELGVRDTCNIITVTKENIKDIPETVEYFSSKGIWTGLDFIHFDKGGYNFSCAKDSASNLYFTRNDLPLIQEIADKLIIMKKKGALIFPTYEVLEMWKKPQYSIDLDWKCYEPVCITLDSDGSLLECDEFQGSRIKKWNIFDLYGAKKWDEFAKDYMNDVVYECRGCFWSTHVMAMDIFGKKDGIKYYQHENATYKN